MKKRSHTVTVRLNAEEYGIIKSLSDKGVSISQALRELIQRYIEPSCVCVEYSWNARTRTMSKGGCNG